MAVVAYNGLWQAMAEASHTSNWEDPELPRYASGAALQVVTGSLYADQLNGVVTRGEPLTYPHVTSVSPSDAPTSVMISDCADSTNWLKYRLDGSLLDEDPDGMRRITAEVRLHTDGLWRVTRFAIEGVGSC